jgi:hypothetical protein
MKKIINGKIYDTAKAMLVGYYDNIGVGVDSRSDFGYWEAELYKTPRSGTFFLAGEGGPMSPFGRQSGLSTWSWGEKIIPLSLDEAQQWAERYLKPEIVEHYFSVERGGLKKA